MVSLAMHRVGVDASPRLFESQHADTQRGQRLPFALALIVEGAEDPDDVWVVDPEVKVQSFGLEEGREVRSGLEERLGGRRHVPKDARRRAI